MASNEEVIKLILSVTDSGTVDEAIVKLEKLKKTSQDAAGAADGAAGSHANFGRALLGAQYAMDDFVAVYENQGFARAIASMQNNIPQVALALGAGSGLTAVIGALSIGLGLAIPAIQKFWASFTGSDADEAKKSVKEMREEAEKAVKEWEKLRDRPTKAEAVGAKGLTETMDEIGENIARGLALSMEAMHMGGQLTEDEKQRQAMFQAGIAREGIDTPQGRQYALQLQRAREEAAARTGKVTAGMAQGMVRALGGEGTEEERARARQTTIAMMGAKPEFFPGMPGFLGDVERADPKAIKAQEELEARGARNIEQGNKALKDEQERQATIQREKAKEAAARDREAAEAQTIEGDWNRHLQQMRRQDEAEAKAAAARQKHEQDRQRRQRLQHEAQNIEDQKRARHEQFEIMRENMARDDEIWRNTWTEQDQFNFELKMRGRQLDNVSDTQKRRIAAQQESITGGGSNR